MPASTPRRSPRPGPRWRDGRATRSPTRARAQGDAASANASAWPGRSARSTSSRPAPTNGTSSTPSTQRLAQRAGAARRRARRARRDLAKPTTAPTRCAGRAVDALQHGAPTSTPQLARDRSRCCTARRRSSQDAAHTLPSYLRPRRARSRAAAPSSTSAVGLDGAGAPLPPPAGRAAGAAGAVAGTSCARSTPPPTSTRCERAADAARARLRRRGAGASRRRARAGRAEARRRGDAGDAAARHGRRPLRGRAASRSDAPQSFGLESVEFLVAGHAGSTPRPLGQGGLGRRAVAHRAGRSPSTHRARRTPATAPATLIFDEVDAGVGGAVAETVGRLMKQLGRDRQVLAVTHLPQVAACADHHFVVSKRARDGTHDERRRSRSPAKRASPRSRACSAASACRAPASRMRRRCSAARGRSRRRRARPQAVMSRSTPTSAPRRATPTPRRSEVVLVTGISGSGKSVALHALEDAGFFCVDNLPPELLRDFLRARARSARDRRVAIAVDVRSAGSLPHLLPLLDELRGEGVLIRSLFLDATTDALVRRFSETRRPHPLSHTPAARRHPARAGRGDRARARAAGRAARGLDRDRHQPAAPGPAAQLDARAGRRAPTAALTLVFESLRLQARRAARRRLRVRRARAAQPALHPRAAPADRARRAGRRLPRGAARGRSRCSTQIEAFLRRWLPAFEADQRSYLTVAIGCTGGQHRSV